MKRETWEEPEIEPVTQFMFIVIMTVLAEALAELSLNLVAGWWAL